MCTNQVSFLQHLGRHGMEGMCVLYIASKLEILSLLHQLIWSKIFVTGNQGATFLAYCAWFLFLYIATGLLSSWTPQHSLRCQEPPVYPDRDQETLGKILLYSVWKWQLGGPSVNLLIRFQTLAQPLTQRFIFIPAMCSTVVLLTALTTCPKRISPVPKGKDGVTDVHLYSECSTVRTRRRVDVVAMRSSLWVLGDF